MKKNRMGILLVCSSVLLSGCGIFPKEEELKKTPIIQAYEKEPFRMVKVKRGELKQYETIAAVCMNLGETQYSFKVNDVLYKGIYVTQGEQIQAGTLLAELSGDGDSAVAAASQLQLYAQTDGVVTFVKGIDDNEKSVAGQIVATINSTKGYYLNAYTKNWAKFTKGQQVLMKIAGKEYTATVMEAQDLGLSSTVRPQNPDEPSEVYFYVEDESAYMQSGDKGEFNLLVEERKDALYIPKGVVTTVDDKKIVYVENKDGIRSVQYIETGIETNKSVEVVSGLKEGDTIIVD